MMDWINVHCLVLVCIISASKALISLPSFAKMKANYPGYKHYGGHYRNNRLINMIGCRRDLLLHDTSALRLSYAFNKAGEEHSLGRSVIHLSRKGVDSVTGSNGLQYLYHPIAYGPYLADKYGYPTISKPHQLDPVSTKQNFWGKQGILRVITYRKIKNLPVGHVALWDCDHFHETKDWISRHSLITVEFWEAPDSNCSLSARYGQNATKSNDMESNGPLSQSISQSSSNLQAANLPEHLRKVFQQGNQVLTYDPKVLKKLLKNKAFRKQFIKKYYVSNGHLRHAKHKGLQ